MRSTPSRISAGSRASRPRSGALFGGSLLACRPLPVLERGRSQTIPLAPFLFTLRMGDLQLLAALLFAPIAMLPLAAAAGEDEAANEQAEHEYQEDDDPLVSGELQHVGPL